MVNWFGKILNQLIKNYLKLNLKLNWVAILKGIAFQ